MISPCAHHEPELDPIAPGDATSERAGAGEAEALHVDSHSCPQWLGSRARGSLYTYLT